MSSTATLLSRVKSAAVGLAFVLIVSCLSRTSAEGQCPSPPIILHEASESRQDPNACQGMTKTFDEIVDFPQGTGCPFLINRFVTHVTEQGTKNCGDLSGLPVTLIETTASRLDPDLCQGLTRTFDEITEIPLGNPPFRIQRFVLHVTEIGTKNCAALPIQIIETNETRSNGGLCEGHSRTFDEVIDVPIGAPPFLIRRFINHVTEVGTKSCGGPSNPIIIVHENNETRENSSLCQGQTRTFDEVSDFPEGRPPFLINRFINHVTEVGTKNCGGPSNPVINVVETNETRQNPDLCLGQTRTFDEVTDFPIGNPPFLINRFIVHVTEIGTKQCEEPPSPCRYLLSPQAGSFPADGGSGSASLTFDPTLRLEDLCPWRIEPSANWIVLNSPIEGIGPATIAFTVLPNPRPTPRQGTIIVRYNGSVLLFEVTQASNQLAVSLTDPAACLGAGKQIGVTVWISNFSEAALTGNLTVSLPLQLTGIAGSCTTTSGVCVVTDNTVTWSGSIAPQQSIPIIYQAQLAATTPDGTTLTINNMASFSNGEFVRLPYSFPVVCPSSATAETGNSDAHCGLNSFAAPLLTNGINLSDEIFLLARPLTLTIISPQPGSEAFQVNEQTFGALQPGFVNATTEGLLLKRPGATTRAISSKDSFKRINFAIASSGAAGDAARLFLQDEQGGNVRELARFTVDGGGLGLRVEQIHPQATLWLNNRFATGPGLRTGDVLALDAAAGTNGKRTGVLTLALSGALEDCSQLGLEVKRLEEEGSLALVLTDVLVRRIPREGDKDHEATGLLRLGRDVVPTGLPCGSVSPLCPPLKPALQNCTTGCFLSADRMTLLLSKSNERLGLGTVTYLGSEISTTQREVLASMLRQNFSQRLRFGREHLALQLSLMREDRSERERIKNSSLACQGLSFAPVTLSTGVTLSANSTMRTLLEQAQVVSVLGLAIDDSRDAAAILAILIQLNRCER